MDVLLSIKPEYADSIYRKVKRYEFRKAIFDVKKVNKVYVYSSSPQQRVTGWFTVKRVIEDSPKALWERCGDSSGLKKREFFAYFKGYNKGYAIEVGRVTQFDNPINPKEMIEDFHPPQSFLYLPTDAFLKKRSLLEWDSESRD